MPDSGGGFTYFRSGAERAADAEAEPETQAQATSAESSPEVSDDNDADYPDDGTIPEVKDWIGDDPGRAQEALDREQDRSSGPRVTLVDYLTDLLADAADDDDDDES